MYNRIQLVNLSVKEVTFGDVITVIKVLQKCCKVYSNDLENNLENEQVVKILKYFQSQENIPEFEFLGELNCVIADIIGKEINSINDKLYYILPKCFPRAHEINEDLLEYANKNLWKVIVEALINKLNNNNSIENVVIKFRIPEYVISNWYGTISDINIKEDMDTWLKLYKLGRCYNVSNKEGKLVYEMKIQLVLER